MRHFNPREKNLLIKLGYSLQDIERMSHSAVKNIPVEYLINQAEFMDLFFYVDENVLIPRVESEKLELLFLHYFRKNCCLNQTYHVVDVGCGSGALGLAIYYYLIRGGQNNFSLQFLDISHQAIKICQKNYQTTKNLIRKSNSDFDFSVNVSFKVSNLLEMVKSDPLDLVIANLPYLKSKDLKKCQQSVKKFEPHIALDGGKQGSYLINQLLSQINRQHPETKAVFLETGLNYTFPANVIQRWTVMDHEDIFGKKRFFVLEKKLK